MQNGILVYIPVEILSTLQDISAENNKGVQLTVQTLIDAFLNNLFNGKVKLEYKKYDNYTSFELQVDSWTLREMNDIAEVQGTGLSEVFVAMLGSQLQE